jgi:tRNA (cmo5U34)-methyltransferase
MITVAVGWLKHFAGDKKPLRILDVGCGTGNTTLELLREFPEAQISCLDGSALMIQTAQKKLAGRNVEYCCLDLTADHWNVRWIDSPFDAAISVLVLEHLPFHTYRTFLVDLLAILKNGAWAVAVEGHAGERTQQIYFEDMAELERDAIRKNILTAVQLDQIRRMSAQKEVHYFTPVHQKKQWWEDAGFADVDLIWHYYCVGILAGRKPL